ncbi:reverse transcriptase domain, reverse transcriptase zinc-binding domain protein [Tanacetum coccineum]
MFAFCRYIKASNSATLIDSLSKVWIGKLRLHANVARFDRNAVGKTSHAGVKVDTPVVNKGSKVVVDDYGEHESVINLQVCSSNDFPLAILGCYKDLRYIANARTLSRCEDFLEVDIKYLGGLWVLFEFRTVDSRNKFLKHKGILSWFSSLKPWYDDFVVEERLVWLEIEGVPLRAWNNDTFNLIGSTWGEVLFCDDSNSCNRLSKRICIKSTHSQLIFATMMVSLKKVTYAIRVRELCSWTPSFVDEDSCKDEEGSMGSYNQDQKEEGELKENDVELHADIPNDIGDAHVKFVEEHEKAHNNTVEEPHIFKGSDVEPQEVEPLDSDPFRLESLINKKSGKAFESKCPETPEFPQGFSPTPNNNQHATNFDVRKLN